MATLLHWIFDQEPHDVQRSVVEYRFVNHGSTIRQQLDPWTLRVITERRPLHIAATDVEIVRWNWGWTERNVDCLIVYVRQVGGRKHR